MFKTITSKFAGTCKRCNGPIKAGTKVRWAKGRGAYHLSAECPAGKKAESVAEFDQSEGNCWHPANEYGNEATVPAGNGLLRAMKRIEREVEAGYVEVGLGELTDFCPSENY